MKNPKLSRCSCTLALLAAWMGKFVPLSWPDGY